MFRFGREVSGSADIKRRAFSISAIVSLVLAAAFLVFLVTRFDVKLGDTWSTVRGSNPWLLVGAFLVHYTTFIFRGARWRLLLQNTEESGASVPGPLYCGQLVLLGWFVNAVGWLRVGDAYRAYVYREEQNASFSRTIGTILAERVLDGLLIVLLLVVAVPFLIKSDGGAAWTVLVVAAVLVSLLASLLVVMVWAQGWALRRLPGWLSERYSRFHQGTLGSFRRIVPVTVLGLLGWMSEVGRLYLVVQALDLDLSFPLVIFLTLANSLLTLVPTPGGIGAVESGVAGLAVRLSTVSGSIAAAMVLVDRAITYLSIIIVGALLFLGRQGFRRRQPAGAEPIGVGQLKDQ